MRDSGLYRVHLLDNTPNHGNVTQAGYREIKSFILKPNGSKKLHTGAKRVKCQTFCLCTTKRKGKRKKRSSFQASARSDRPDRTAKTRVDNLHSYRWNGAEWGERGGCQPTRSVLGVALVQVPGEPFSLRDESPLKPLTKLQGLLGTYMQTK